MEAFVKAFVEASVELASVEAFISSISSMEASITSIKASMKDFVEVTSVKASMKDSVEVTSVEASITSAKDPITSIKASIEAFVEVTSMEAFVEAFVKAPVEATSVENFISPICSMDVSTAYLHGSGESFHGSFRELPRKMQVVQKTVTSSHGMSKLNNKRVQLQSSCTPGKTHPHSILQVPTMQLAKMSIDPKFVELTADVLEIFLLNYSQPNTCQCASQTNCTLHVQVRAVCGQHYSIIESKPMVVEIRYENRSGYPQQEDIVWVVILFMLLY